MQKPRVKTPCIGVCSTGIGDEVCRGCKRFTHEVIHWNSYSEAQKQVIDQRLGEFLSQCVRNKLRVTDQELLLWQIQVQQLRYPAQHDEYCWAYALIKAGGSQIEDPAGYGLELFAAFRDTPLPQLRLQIDEEFFTLSQAHYDRYMRVPDLFGSPAS